MVIHRKAVFSMLNSEQNFIRYWRKFQKVLWNREVTGKGAKECSNDFITELSSLFIGLGLLKFGHFVGLLENSVGCILELV